VDERGLARSRDSDHNGEDAERDVYVDVLQVVPARPADPQGALRRANGRLEARSMVEMPACQGVGSAQTRDIPRVGDVAAATPRSRAEIDEDRGREVLEGVDIRTVRRRPDPLTPVKTVRRRFGISSEMFFRLFSRAPTTRMTSCASATCPMDPSTMSGPSSGTSVPHTADVRCPQCGAASGSAVADRPL
jgi:hypothetical protein